MFDYAFFIIASEDIMSILQTQHEHITRQQHADIAHIMMSSSLAGTQFLVDLSNIWT